MTEKRFTYFKSKIGFGKQGIDDNLKGYTFDFTMDNVLDCMNDLSEENEKLKRILNELSDMLQFDVENGIRSYPVKLSEYLSNALKELKE